MAERVETGRSRWADEAVARAQRLRIRRFATALATYALVSFATVLTCKLGLGDMKASQWAFFLAVAVVGNSVFLAAFLTGFNLRFSDPSLTREQIFYSTCWGLVALYFLPAARPIVLMFYIPAFSFGMLSLRKGQYLGLTAAVMTLYGAVLLLEYLQGSRPFNPKYEIFLFVLFGILLTWFATFGGFVSDLRRRLGIQNREMREAKEKIESEMAERLRAEREKERVIEDLRAALNQVKTLKGLLPICANCKKIRDDKGYWNQIEAYISTHSDAEFSHGICPECAEKLYGDLVLSLPALEKKRV